MTDVSYAKVIADSVSPDGHRLATLEVRFHRFVLAEFNTHRVFCLSGDTQLWCRQPNGTSRKVNLADLYEKWTNGAAERPSKTGKDWPLHLLRDDFSYTMPEAAAILGMANATNLNRYCREKRINAYQHPTGTWETFGRAIKLGLRGTTNRQPIRSRLKRVALDQIDQSTLELGLTNIVDVIDSGIKSVFEVKVGGHTIKTSKDHLFWTPDGWKKLREFSENQKVAVVQRGKPQDEHHGDRFKIVNGRWVSQWIRSIKDQLPEYCACGKKAVDAHHIVPVHADPTLAFELSNIEHLCKDCHTKNHSVQGWQTGVQNYVDFVAVDSIKYIGEEHTYDITVAGEEPNFIANGFVVHNSRNSASSRAIPVEKTLERLFSDPAFPVSYPSEQPGMSGGSELYGPDLLDAELLLKDIADYTLKRISEYVKVHPKDGITHRLHKSVLNRPMEWFSDHTVIVSSTEWQNFFDQRCSPDAQPEIRVVAEKMQQALWESKPVRLGHGEWHMPYIEYQDLVACKPTPPEDRAIDPRHVSAARCARVSYLTHAGFRDVELDEDLYKKLTTANPPHWSPLEHVATPVRDIDSDNPGNFTGWTQLRHWKD